jgi:predicted RNA methylase
LSTIPATFNKEGRFTDNPMDFFPTPAPVVRACLQKLEDLRPLRGQRKLNDLPYVLDPGCGDGVWGRGARELWGADFSLDGVDLIDRDAPRGVYDSVAFVDFLDPAIPTLPVIDRVIGNPPFSVKGDKTLARKFVETGLAYLRPDGLLGFLLKMEAVNSGDRFKTLYRDNPPLQVWVLVQRPSFNGTGKTNTIEYGFFIFAKQNLVGYSELRWLDWKGK